MNIKNVLNRIPSDEGFIRVARCGEGWRPLIKQIDEMISFIDPNYTVFQIKEKFGTLRFYYETKFPLDSTEEKIIKAIVAYGEMLSCSICETCGTRSVKVKLRTSKSWIRTLCDTCATEHGYFAQQECRS